MTTSFEARVPYERRIFCNRNLRLDRVRFIGFDMDYTLALYHEAMEHLQAESVLARLVETFGYPKAVLEAKYEPGFAIRGLAVDMEHGNIFKMDRHRFVGRVWHGTKPLDRDLRRDTYTNRKISPADPSILMVDSLFSLPEISLYGQLVDYFDSLPEGTDKPTYERLWKDLRQAMDSLHRDGTLKADLMENIPKYIMKDDALAETLHRFRSANKKLFLMTNSEPIYTEAVMSFLLDGAHAAYGNWRDYFDIIITSSQKPSFFSSDDPFLEVDDETLEPGTEPATALKRGTIYLGGNVAELHRLTGMEGDDVLYVGDHIYGDILRSKRSTSWRTAMVIQDMEKELGQLHDMSAEIDQLNVLEETRFQLELERAAQALDGVRDKDLLQQISGLNRQLSELEARIAHAFNPAWGPSFRDRGELSAFGSQVEGYACVYTGRVTNFRFYSPFWYFRSPRDRMAHEIRR